MPPTIQWYVRTALLNLVASVALGVAYQADLWLGWLGLPRYVVVVHGHLALMGGVVQMIMGVGLWIFPLTAPLPERMPFREPLAWSTYALFNGGLLLRFPCEYLFRTASEPAARDLWGGLTTLTGVAQGAALLVFVYHLWSLRISRRAQARAREKKQGGS